MIKISLSLVSLRYIMQCFFSDNGEILKIYTLIMFQLFCNEEFFMSNTVTWQISEHINSEWLDDLLECSKFI